MPETACRAAARAQETDCEPIEILHGQLHRSASRMLSEMLCEGALQSRLMMTGGVNAMAARTVHPTKDVAPRT